MEQPNKSVSEIVTHIDAITKKVFSSQNDAEYLSRAAGELASLKLGLGSWVALARDEERLAAAELKAKKAKQYQIHRAEMSQADADIQSLLDTEEMLKAYNKIAYNKDICTIKHSDTQTVIDSIRSRLATVRNDINNGSSNN